MILKLFLIFMMATTALHTQAQSNEQQSSYGLNKQIPESIKQKILKALAFYPELRETHIKFIFKSRIKTSVMQAQPVYSTLLGRKKNRRYRVNIAAHFKLVNSELPILTIPDEVFIGWIGHELGHILDYEGKSNMEMISFGYRYVFHSSFVKHAEMMADSYAVERGMGNYIVATKRFILNNAELPQAYKDKISRLYLSPDIIVEKVRALEQKKLEEASADEMIQQ